MTECERIIKEGILPESFFIEEVRDDFLFTTEKRFRRIRNRNKK